MKHPLLNPKSLYYHAQRISAIEQLEQELSLSACIGYAEGNIIRYSYRLDYKGQKEEDLEKLETFKKYLQWLRDLEAKVEASTVLTKAAKEAMPVADLYDFFKIEVDYHL